MLGVELTVAVFKGLGRQGYPKHYNFLEDFNIPLGSNEKWMPLTPYNKSFPLPPSQRILIKKLYG